VYGYTDGFTTALSMYVVVLAIGRGSGAVMSDSSNIIEVIGADISLREIVLAWARSQRPCLSIANNRKAIVAWLKQLPAGCVIGMEATGRLHHLLADLAVKHGHSVYVLNPKHVASYAKGVGQRGKTDPMDAAVIARYVDRERDGLHAYTIPSALQRTLRDLITQRASVVRHGGALKQSIRATGTARNSALKRAHKAALKSLNALLTEINNELKRAIAANDALETKRKQLQSITGIGFVNSAALIHRFDRTPFANSDAVVAAYGLDPRPKDSGNHLGKRRLTKQGNSEDRRLIYLAAQSASKTKLFNPIYRSLLARGLSTTAAIVILARKLLRIAFAIWTYGKPFNPNKIGKRAC
jgi:transposase